jgi:hypothetical protein
MAARIQGDSRLTSKRPGFRARLFLALSPANFRPEGPCIEALKPRSWLIRGLAKPETETERKEKAMIILNGKKFAETEQEFTESLFEPDGTCVGYAKRNKSSVTLKNPQKEKVGVINKWGVLCCATRMDDGKWWYSYADISEVGRYEYARQVDECRAALDGGAF